MSPGDIAPTVTTSDKVDHLLSFGALTAVGLLALDSRRHTIALAATGMWAYGVLIELLQTQIPGRYGEVEETLSPTRSA